MYLGLKVLLYNNRQTGQNFAIKIQDAANKAMFENETLLLRATQGSPFATKLCGLITTKVSIKKLAKVFQHFPRSNFTGRK